jgi:hypothetical protein
MLIVDHHDPHWLYKFKRTNGALTYSQDLIKYQIPHWEKVLGDTDIISTCPKMSELDVTGRFENAVQYLHSYPYYNPVGRVIEIAKHLPFKTKKIVFLAAYKELVTLLKEQGLKAVYAPMGIDVATVQSHAFEGNRYPDRIIWFGNVLHTKVKMFNTLRNKCRLQGLAFDHISVGRFNFKTKVDHEEALRMVSRYRYGIGVGRCALEMQALGLKVVIAGQKFGGIITNDREFNLQTETNMNGRIITYNRSIEQCIKDIDMSLVRTNDITTMNHALLAREYFTDAA